MTEGWGGGGQEISYNEQEADRLGGYEMPEPSEQAGKFAEALVKGFHPLAKPSFWRWRLRWKLPWSRNRALELAYTDGFEVGLRVGVYAVDEVGRFAAQGTEARRAETENTGSVHDGPVAASHAPKRGNS